MDKELAKLMLPLVLIVSGSCLIIGLIMTFLPT